MPELAQKLGIDARELAATVEAYNAACPAGAFKPLELDGLSTQPGYVPKKSNWARRIDKPPFLAFPIICGNCFTFGGLKVDTQARVINADGAVIPGLYAAGETIGLYYGTYAGATSVLRGAVFGRIAGAARGVAHVLTGHQPQHRFRREFAGHRQIGAAERGEFRRHHAVAGDARPQEALFRARAQLLCILHGTPAGVCVRNSTMQKHPPRRRVPRSPAQPPAKWLAVNFRLRAPAKTEPAPRPLF